MSIYEKVKRNLSELSEMNSTVNRKLNNSQYQRDCALYAKYLETTTINPDIVLYESFWGRGIIDNPNAIFKELLHNKQYSYLKHVWVLNDLESNQYFIDRYASYDNVKFIVFKSKEYYKYLATAKYLVNNTTFEPYFIKREGQVYINTWHGTPLKSMGFNAVGSNTTIGNILRNMLITDYFLSANDIMTDMYLNAYKLKEVMTGTIVEEGYPRNDALLNTKKEDIIETLIDLGVSVDPKKQIVMYAPTWRQDANNKAVINPAQLLNVKEHLEKLIDASKYQILVKPHQFVYEALKDNEEYKGLLIPSSIDTNELLSVTDVLISDYSSIFMDYLVTDKPVVFYIKDAEEYTNDRGLDISIDELPGPVCSTIQELADAINHYEEIADKEKYKKFKDRICKYDDGNVTKRIVDIIWGGNQKYNLIKTKKTKKRLLISGGNLLENGITHSFFSLLNQVNYDEWDVTAYFFVSKNNKELLKKVDEEINKNVRAYMRVGDYIATKSEQIARLFVERKSFDKKIWRVIYPKVIAEREYQRCFGNLEFDYIVDFNGYSRALSPIFLQGKAKKKSIWMHNDIKADMNKIVNGKKRNLEVLRYVVSLYNEFDNIVGCGKGVMEENRKKLATPETYDKFKYAKNTVNLQRIDALLENDDVVEVGGKLYYVATDNDIGSQMKSVHLIKLPDSNKTTFITVGRMSTEKNHMALVKAFAKLTEIEPNTELYIIGEGPLRKDIEQLITTLGMNDKVFLTGNIRNPFVFMKASDCFVLPSLHEGQPLVLLEARYCGLPIILSDFLTAKDSCYPNSQLLIGHTEEDILDGLVKFIRGEVPSEKYDVNLYNQEAFNEFVKAIM